MNHSVHTVACSVFSMNSILTQMARQWVSNHSQVQLSNVARYVAAEDDLNEECTDLGSLLFRTELAFSWAAMGDNASIGYTETYYVFPAYIGEAA